MIGAKGLRSLLIATACLVGASTHAEAANLCDLAMADSFAKASSALEAAGCAVAREEGTSSRAFACEGGAWATLDASMQISIVTPGNFPLEIDPRCAGKNWFEGTRVYDNPLVKRVLKLGSSTLPDAQLAVISLDQQTPFLNWICVSKSGCFLSSYDRALKGVLKKYLGDDTLTFSQSEVRVAGTDITKARRGELEGELTSRGATLSSHDGGPLISRSTFGQVSGVPGLNTIEVAYLADRITTVRYPIPAEADFSTFVRSLDERYGPSSATTGKACVVRSWKNGGVTILGELCAGKPEKSGFTFINTGAAAIVRGLEQLASNPTAPIGKAQPRPKTDMY